MNRCIRERSSPSFAGKPVPEPHKRYSGETRFPFLIQNLHYFGLIPPLRVILFVGYIGFFFLQSLALSHRFAHTFKKATFLAQQGLKTKSEFLSTMSHEIRTPLNAVIGMTHLLLRQDPREDQKEDLGVLLFSANNLLSIVNNILDYNKIEEGKIYFEQIPMNPANIARNIVAAGPVCKHAWCGRAQQRSGRASLIHTHDWLQMTLKYDFRFPSTDQATCVH